MTIGEKIKQRREQLGYTQETLAFKLGYKGRSSVNKVENSKEVSIKKIKKYAEALDTTVAYLMGWEEEFSEESAEIDVKLSMYSMKDKEYMIKLAELSEEDKSAVYKLIDALKK